MKKATKPGATRAPAKKAAPKKSPVKARSGARGPQAEMVAILERFAQSAERLARAAERLEAAVRPLAAQQSEQPPLPPDETPETPAEVVGVLVVDEGDEE